MWNERYSPVFHRRLVRRNAGVCHQDRSKDGQPFPLRSITDGASGCAADTLSGNPEWDRPPGTSTNLN